MENMKESLSLFWSLDSKVLWVFSAFSAAPQELWVISSSAEIKSGGKFHKFYYLTLFQVAQQREKVQA